MSRFAKPDNPQDGAIYEDDNCCFYRFEGGEWVMISEVSRLRKPVVEFEYTNWRGKTATRRGVPRDFWYGKTRWHNQEQWFLEMFDFGKLEMRHFSIADIDFKTWRTVDARVQTDGAGS